LRGFKVKISDYCHFGKVVFEKQKSSETLDLQNLQSF
jgi:hypothetical protein